MNRDKHGREADVPDDHHRIRIRHHEQGRRGKVSFEALEYSSERPHHLDRERDFARDIIAGLNGAGRRPGMERSRRLQFITN